MVHFAVVGASMLHTRQSKRVLCVQTCNICFAFYLHSIVQFLQNAFAFAFAACEMDSKYQNTSMVYIHDTRMVYRITYMLSCAFDSVLASCVPVFCNLNSHIHNFLKRFKHLH